MHCVLGLRSCFGTNVFVPCVGPVALLKLFRELWVPLNSEKKKKTPIVSVNGFVDALLLFGQLASEAGKSAN